ncbi:MAG TPA: extracellular solute-binding protein [Acidimicrobiales bacterium]|nr:extracellular solute-binding protein [Acidimicrobiales bacterium]
MTNRELSRRELLRRLGIGGAALALPATVLAACGGEQGGADTATATTAGGSGKSDLTGSKIKVATFGGFFEENFAAIYPKFTEETGIEVESVSEPGGDAWIVQLEQAVRSGGVPADVSMLNNISILRALKGDIVLGYSGSDLTNAKYLADGFVMENDGGDVVGVGAASWYITLVSNTDRVPESPTSWKALWDPQWADELALINTPNTSFLLEITAACWFPDDDQILKSQEGVDELLAKLAEVKPNVKLWWRDEATAQQDYNSGEVSLGEFYHDITTYAISQGEPLSTVFPEEGAVLDSGLWAITSTTKEPEASIAFVDWMCQPEIQAELARVLGTSPTVAKEHMDLTDADYEAVSGPGPDAALRPEYPIYQEWEDWVNQRWAEQIFSE